MIETSARTYSRAIGILLILTIFGGWFGELYVPSQIVASNAATTAAHLSLNGGLFRLGFAAYLVEAFSDLVLAWLFYVLLRPVHRELALLSAFFGIVSMALFAVTQMFYFSAPMFLSGSGYLTAFSPEQLPCDKHIGFVDQQRIGESEYCDRLHKLVDLAFGMGPRITRIRLKRAGRPIYDLQLMRRGACPRNALAHIALEHSGNIAASI